MSNKDISLLVDELLREGEVTREKIAEGLNSLQNPMDRLNYLNQLLTYTSLPYTLSGMLNVDKAMICTMLALQNQEILNARRTLEVAEGPNKDGLTGLLRREEIEGYKQRNPKQNYVVAMIDIDNFKQVNDTYGHLIGDLIIKNVAKVILESVRENSVYRYGGEEIYVEFNQTDLAGGRKAAERIRQDIEEKVIGYVIQDVEGSDNNELKKHIDRLKGEKITISVGISEERQGRTHEEALAKTDEALYLAKKYGKNRVVASGENPSDGYNLYQISIVRLGSFLESLGKRTTDLSKRVMSSRYLR